MRGDFRNIAVLAPFAAGIGRRPGHAVRAREDLAEAMAALGGHCVLEVPRELAADGRIAVALHPADGLTPAGWVPRTPPLADLAAARAYLQSADQGTPPARIAAELRQRWPQLTGDWLDGAPDDNGAVAAGRSAVDDLLDLVALPPGREDAPGQAPAVSAWRRDIDSRLAVLLEHILAHPDYRKRVAAWRGLGWLHDLGQGRLQWRLVDVDRDDLPELLPSLVEELVQDEPDLVLVDLPFDHTPRDLDSLAALAGLGDRLLAPVLAWAGANFFSLSSWRELPRLPYLATHMDRPQYAKWRSLRARSEARWLALSVGRFTVDEADALGTALAIAPPATEPTWLSPIWVLAALVVQQQERSGLPFPVADQAVDPPGEGAAMEVASSGDRSEQLQRAGFAPLLALGPHRLGFAAMPLADGTDLDQQLLVRRLLNWLFAEQRQQPLATASQLRAVFLESLHQAGLAPPDEFTLAVENGTLSLTMHLAGRTSRTAGQVTLHLPWEETPPADANRGETL